MKKSLKLNYKVSLGVYFWRFFFFNLCLLYSGCIILYYGCISIWTVTHLSTSQQWSWNGSEWSPSIFTGSKGFGQSNMHLNISIIHNTRIQISLSDVWTLWTSPNAYSLYILYQAFTADVYGRCLFVAFSVGFFSLFWLRPGDRLIKDHFISLSVVSYTWACENVETM